MLRRGLFALVGVISAALAPTRAADGDLSGNWQLTRITATHEVNVCVLKIETKNGKPTATVLFAPADAKTELTEFRVTDSRVVVTVRQVHFIGGKRTHDLAFVGARGADPKVILGSAGTATERVRARLTATDKEKLEPEELVVKVPLPKAMANAQRLSADVVRAENKLLAEQDEEKRKELTKRLVAATKEADAKQPDLWRAVVAEHADTPAAFEAATNLLRAAERLKMTADEAEKLVRLIQKQGAPHGPLLAGAALAPVVEPLADEKMEALALSAIEPAAKALSADDPASARAAILSAYQTALERSNRADEAKAVALALTKLEPALDAEYLKTVPPFAPVAFAGRRDKSANRVAVLELFTGAQCPKCPAADAAFDALLKTYEPTDVVLVQYHGHFPGPDPLTNPDAVTRLEYYDTNSAPSALFNGRPFDHYDKNPAHSGGGPPSLAEDKYRQYRAILDPLLEKTTAVKLSGTAARTGDKIDIQLEGAGTAGADLKLRVLVVEKTVKYVGGNRVRFHHHVVRAMPGGADGVAIRNETFKHAARVDLADVRKELTKYLNEYGEVRKFPNPNRPMEMKDLKVVALVQNDKTKEIVQAVQIEVGGSGR